MKHAENEYLNLCRHVMEHGTKKEDRTGQALYLYLDIKCVLI